MGEGKGMVKGRKELGVGGKREEVPEGRKEGGARERETGVKGEGRRRARRRKGRGREKREREVRKGKKEGGVGERGKGGCGVLAKRGGGLIRALTTWPSSSKCDGTL